MNRNEFTKKLVKHIVVSLLIAGFVFSNLSFLVLSSTFDFIKQSNIVDKLWNLEKNSNIVYNF